MSPTRPKGASNMLPPHAHELFLVVLRIDRRVGDRDVTQVDLHGPNIIAVVDHIKAASMPEHVRVHTGQGGVLAALL